MTRQFSASILAVVLVTATACGKSAEQEQAEKAAVAAAEAAKAGADQMAAGAAAMAKGLEQMTQAAGAGKVQVVPFETLGAAFPEVSGWTRGEVTGSTSNFPMAVSQSQANYRNGNARVKLEVVDAALSQILLAPFSMFLAANFSERSSDGYKKGTSIKGEPGFEEVNTKSEKAELTVVVGKRFIVSSHGSGGATIEQVRAVVEQMDFGKLTAAK